MSTSASQNLDTGSHTSANYSSFWVRPNDLMKSRKLKSRRYALKARMNTSQSIRTFKKLEDVNEGGKERSNLKERNPFKCLQAKHIKLYSGNDSPENSSDGSLFHLFDSQPKENQLSNSSYNCLNSVPPISCNGNAIQDSYDQAGSNVLYIDWSLKSRIRFYSSKPLPWKHTFKTSEEASGTTGFVRCLNSKTDAEGVQTLDTSTNAQFYQSCLYWQHPNLPTISLFPRDKQKTLAQTGLYGAEPISSVLHTEWSESLRSLYQLLRVRQCPFFYVCAHSFTCLFRAAGAAGFPHTHALISPTTRGFRDAMKREGVDFSMPLYGKGNKTEDVEDSAEKKVVREVDTEEEHESEDFLETLGLETSQFPSLNQSRTKVENKKFGDVDRSPESLVYVKDMELQGLINFILNCGSCISITGAMAGVPPTLLSPVGFHGGTLKSLKISAGTVRTPDGDRQYSVDLQGAILPSAVLRLCSLLATSLDTFSASLTPVVSTISFSATSPSTVGSPMPMAFANEGLVDCGLGKDIRTVLCKSTEDLREKNLPLSYREIKYENCRYFCSDKI